MRGAIQLSLGFIVAVVFAIVLLSLAITWLQGIIGGISGLTENLIQESHEKLRETFEQTDSTFAIWPSRYELSRGGILKMSAGIKNNADDGQNHKFVINVIPTGASTSICPEGDVELCTAPGGGSLKEYMQKWATWTKSPTTIMINHIGYNQITIKVPSNARSGTYIFNVVACIDYDRYDECTLETLNWGGSAQPLTIIVK